MKVLFYAGLFLSSFSTVQILAFFAKAVPTMTGGSVLLLTLIFVGLIILGTVRVSNIASNFGSVTYVAWLPLLAYAAVFFLAIGFGIYIAQ